MAIKPTYEELEKKNRHLEESLQAYKEKEVELQGEMKELRQIHKYYNALMENTQDYIVICDSNGVSKAFNRSYKKRGEELLNIEIKPGIMPHKLSNKPEVIEYWDSLQSRALKGEEFVEESYFKELDQYFETIFCPIKEGNEVTGFTEITRNITERKKAVEDINKSKMKLENIINSLPLGVFIYKLESDNSLIFTYTNLAASRILKVDCSQFIGKTIEEAFPPLAQTEIPLKYKEVCRNGISWHTEQVDYDHDEIKGAFEVHAFQSEPNVAIILFQDITERKRVENALLASEKRFKDLAENSTDWIWEFDENEIFTYASPRVKDLLGFSPEDIIGQSAFDPMPTEESKKVKREFYRHKELKVPFSHLININKHKNGQTVVIESSGIPIFDNDDNFKGYRGIDRDITDRIKLESQLQQARKMEGIGTLAGGIAHDFNNILSPILLHSEMISDDLPSDDPLQHDIKEIYNAGIRAKGLVQQILTYARKGSEEKIILKTSSVIKEALKFLRSSLPTTIDVQYDNKARHDTVLADPTQINQIVINLCTNAAHAMREKGGVLEVTLDNEDISENKTKRLMNLKQGEYLRLSVKDNGTGISSDILEKIFEPYFTTKGVGEGTGFGLANVYSITQNYGGDIIVESEVGKGSTFIIYLPIEKSQAQNIKEENKEIQTGDEHILFVDDESSIVKIMAKSLERLGYNVTGRTSSVDALEAFKNNPDKFDLVITDMTMPNMTGEDLTKELMLVKPGIPVILCTGFSDKLDEKKAKEIGISAFVMKPTVVGELSNTIRKVLEKK